MWNKPWKLKEGFVIGLGLIAVGGLLQISVGPVRWAVFAYPANIIALCVYILLTGTAYALHRKVYAVNFIMSWRSAVPALVYATLLTAIMGITRQVPADAGPADPLGLTKMLSFWPFVMIYVWLSFTVALVGMRQGAHFRWGQLPSAASHAGLFVVMVAGTLGSADMQRLKMFCEKGQPEWRALDDRNNVHELPVAIILNDFILDEYPARLLVIDNKTQMAVKEDGKPVSLVLDSDFKGGQAGEWFVSIGKKKNDDEYYIKADWKPAGMGSAVPENKHAEGWVSAGNAMMPPRMIALDRQHSLVMPQREPKRFASDVQVLTKSGGNAMATIEVNRPYEAEGWKIYQYGYDEQMGKWSNYSVLEFVTDPWLPVVYCGFALLLLGALGMFFTAGRSKGH